MGPAFAQRCGDHVWINLRDAHGRVLQPADFDSVAFTCFDPYSTGGKVQEFVPELIDIPAGVKTYSARTGCGMEWMSFRFARHGQAMLIRLRHVPKDAGNCFLNGFEFHPGTFELDFHGLLGTSCEDDTTTVAPYPYTREKLHALRQEKLIRVNE